MDKTTARRCRGRLRRDPAEPRNFVTSEHRFNEIQVNSLSKNLSPPRQCRVPPRNTAPGPRDTVT